MDLLILIVVILLLLAVFGGVYISNLLWLFLVVGLIVLIVYMVSGRA